MRLGVLHLPLFSSSPALLQLLPLGKPPLDKRGVSAGRTCLSLMYQYQFLPPPSAPTMAWPKWDTSNAHWLPLCLSRGSVGCLLCWKVLNISVHFFKSRFLCHARTSESKDLDFHVWCWTLSSPSSFSLPSSPSSLSPRISLFWGDEHHHRSYNRPHHLMNDDYCLPGYPCLEVPPPQLPTPPSHSVSTQLFPSYLIIWRAHSILSAWWRFSFCLHFSPSTLTMQLDSF